MSQLDKQDIPVLILSAGLGDLIHEVLQQYKVILFQTIFFDDTGTAVRAIRQIRSTFVFKPTYRT